MMMDMVPVAPSMTAVVTPAASREETTTITNNVWLDRLLRGDRLTESEWQLLGTQEKVRFICGPSCTYVLRSYEVKVKSHSLLFNKLIP